MIHKNFLDSGPRRSPHSHHHNNNHHIDELVALAHLDRTHKALLDDLHNIPCSTYEMGLEHLDRTSKAHQDDLRNIPCSTFEMGLGHKPLLGIPAHKGQAPVVSCPLTYLSLLQVFWSSPFRVSYLVWLCSSVWALRGL
ncbi:hypothetical protein PanWU01x14_314940 [Parasponia andersonii]|uniref:Uncharacterized protein n=1 Tax=Parasponia andersonii TaxID=3476 RepID=A0A2P5ANJ9_PARAD|nr:hypothetical protein PanWU01x14_314940 [Parasponia andersonii]